VPIIIVQQLVGIAIFLSAITVGVLTIQHGDLSLGLLVVLGQIQSFIGHNQQSHNAEEATHIAVHKKI
jgi:hypothetical protein